jgi:hypothetical protein
MMGGLTPTTPEVRDWGADGRDIMFEIALLEMHENTRAKVRALLATDSAFGRFSESCSWADLVRSQRNGCAVDAITELAGVLACEGPAGPRLEALKSLTHFVGDLHLTLHAGSSEDASDDRVVLARADSRPRPVASAGRPRQAYAAELQADITPSERARWSDLDPSAWASESRGLTLDRRLEQAGFRLSRVLEQILGTNR